MSASIKKNHILSGSYFLLLILPSLWLFYAASVVDIETYDGYDTIHNAEYFTGDTFSYFPYRPPFISFILAPAKKVSSSLGFDPLYVKIYHLEMALFHILYLIFILHFLKKEFGFTIAVLIAFISAILNFVFFLLTPFLTHDIFPGALFLLMLLLADSYVKKPAFYKFLLLLLLGAVSALIKMIFGVFWFAILISQMILLFSKNKHRSFFTFFHLVVASVLSGLLYWLVIAIVLSPVYSSTPFFLRPWRQIISVYASIPNAHHSLWIYIYNFYFYGVLTTILIIPGLFMAFRKNSFYQCVAISWSFSFVFMHFIRFRETRYLAFLMPLSALLILLPLTELLKKKRFYLPILFLLSFDLYLSINEALRIRDDFYQKSQVKEFISVLDQETPRYFFLGVVSSIPSIPLAFTGDIYHRIFHFAPVHLELLGYTELQYPENFNNAYANRYPNTALFYIRRELINPTTFNAPKRPIEMDEYKAYACKSGKLPITVSNGKWILPDQKKLESLSKNSDGLLQITLPKGNDLFHQYLFLCIAHKEKNLSFPLIPSNTTNSYILATHNQEQFANPEEWEFWGYHIKKMLISKPNVPGTYLLSFD